MFNRLRITLISIFLCQAGIGQQHINFEELDSIVVEVDQNAQAFYMHNLLKGETLYSLSRYFKISYRDLLILNNIDEEDILALGTRIKIPINLDYLDSSPLTPSKYYGIPVIYKVKKQETLFKISQVYFKQKIEHLVARNKIRKLSLRTGEELIVGYWQGKQLPQEWLSAPQSLKDTILPDRILPSTRLDSFTEYEISVSRPDHLNDKKDSIRHQPIHTIKSTKGIALWERSDANVETLLVLHKTAKPGSVIKLNNPVTERSVVAQVVGPIPPNVYTSDIDAIVSRAVAQKLGALDTRFQVMMTFYE